MRKKAYRQTTRPQEQCRVNRLGYLVSKPSPEAEPDLQAPGSNSATGKVHQRVQQNYFDPNISTRENERFIQGLKMEQSHLHEGKVSKWNNGDRGD
jgi:hypothetical protein